MNRVTSRIFVGFAGFIAASAAYTHDVAAQAVQTTATTTSTNNAPVVAPTPANASPAPSQTGMTLPGATLDPAADAADHASVVRHFGIGYMGLRAMAVDADPATGNISTKDAPVIGVRYWLDSMIGIDAGLGLLLSSGSSSTGNVSTGVQGYTVFIVHGGVPLALAGSKHFSFQIVPELNLGFASSQRADNGPDLTGFHLDLGARAGTEIQFGFIGIPELSLQAGVGLALAYDHVKISPAMGDASTVGHTALATSVGNNPWDIFTGNIAALYYFD